MENGEKEVVGESSALERELRAVLSKAAPFCNGQKEKVDEVLHAEHIEAPERTFFVRYDHQAYRPNGVDMTIPSSRRLVEVRADTPAGAIDVTKYHHFSHGANFCLDTRRCMRATDQLVTFEADGIDGAGRWVADCGEKFAVVEDEKLMLGALVDGKRDWGSLHDPAREELAAALLAWGTSGRLVRTYDVREPAQQFITERMNGTRAVNEAAGEYRGRFVFVDGTNAVQDIGQGVAVLHDRAKLGDTPLVGDRLVTVKYRDGRGVGAIAFDSEPIVDQKLGNADTAALVGGDKAAGEKSHGQRWGGLSRNIGSWRNFVHQDGAAVEVRGLSMGHARD